MIGLLAETYFLKSYFVHYLLKIKGPLIFHDRDVYTEEELDKIKVIVELTSSKALLSLFVSFLAFSHVNFIWEQLA